MVRRPLTNNPRWVRGTATSGTLLNAADSSSVATFTSGHSFQSVPDYNHTLPKEGTFVFWAQTDAIIKDALHPEGAKLLRNYLLSDE